MADPCPDCGKDRALVGYKHLCVPRPQAAKRAVHEQIDKALRRSLGRPLDKDRGKTLTARKPWEAEGMSRRTWYRRQWDKRK